MTSMLLDTAFTAASVAIKDILKSENKTVIGNSNAYWTKSGVLIHDTGLGTFYLHSNGILFKLEQRLSGVSVFVRSTTKTLPEDWEISALEMCHAVSVRAVTPESHLPAIKNLGKIVTGIALDKINKEEVSWLIC